MVGQSVIGGNLVEAGEDLWLVGEGLAPARVERERIGVEVRRDVTGGPGVSVVAPGPAEAVVAVEDREAVATGGELNAHRDAAGTGTDHRDLRLLARHLCNHYIYSVMRNGCDLTV